MEFKLRNYRAEEDDQSLPRVHADDHPLIARPSSYNQVDVADSGKQSFSDPLRGPTANLEDHNVDIDVHGLSSIAGFPSDDGPQLSSKEWASFKRSLMQKFPVSKLVSVSSVSDVIIKSGKVYEKSSTSLHLEELDNPQKASSDGVKVLTQQEYAFRLRELKVEIGNAWKADDRVTALKLAIKVAKLLMDTSVSEFYPTLFVLVTDVMDMLGDMVWERIKRKAEYADDGTLICYLQENFGARDVSCGAKETCYNWFCKIGSIRELLPRIYLELSIIRCWRFLHEHPWGCLQRLVMMIRGLSDPLASFYCRLYMVYCAQKLLPQDTGYLFTCLDDIKIGLTSIAFEKDTFPNDSWKNKKLLISLLEPTTEWIMKCICKDAYKKKQFDKILMKLPIGLESSKFSGACRCLSIILHHFLKELPAELLYSHSSYIVQLIESTDDVSLNQHLNYRLLGIKLSGKKPQVDFVAAILDKVFQAITQYDSLYEYLEVADAFLDIILQFNMDNYLTTILDGISARACSNGITEAELSYVESIFIKLLAHVNIVEDAFVLNHFLEILHLMHGSSRDVVNMHILGMATRNGYIRDSSTIQHLYEISQVLHDRIDILNIKDENHKQQAHLISRYIQLVDYGTAVEHHLTFLVNCRGAFGRISELKGILVHSSNSLAIKAIKGANKFVDFVKSCIAFNEVTLPSISAATKRISLYLETVEVALLGGLVSHADGLIDSVIVCLHSLGGSEGLALESDMDQVVPLIQKLCSLLVMIPGKPEQDGICFPLRSVLSVVETYTWITSQVRLRVYCAVVSLSATLSQNKLPYHAREVPGNDVVYFGDPSYKEEIASISSSAVSKIIDVVVQEKNQVTRTNMALEACNCILSCYKESSEISRICDELQQTSLLV